MARKRPRARRILFALLILVLIALLLEINRWLPGRLPGGGGDGGFRQRDTAEGREDGQVTDEGGALTLTPPGLRPPPEVARDGVVVEVRSADGTWLDYRIGAGGRAVEPPRGKQPGTHVLKAKHALAGELRVRTKTQSVAHDPKALGATEGAWVVVMPAAAAKVARPADRITLEFAGLGTAPASYETEAVDGTRKTHEFNGASRVSLPPTKRPQLVRLGASETRPASPWYWVHPRDGSEQSIALESVRRLGMDAGLGGDGVLQEVLGPGGESLPFTTGHGAEAGSVHVRAPADAELVGRFRVEGADVLIAFSGDFAALAPRTIPRRVQRVTVTSSAGTPATNAQLVATWAEVAPGTRSREPVRVSAIGKATGTPGEYEIRIPAEGKTQLLVAAPGAGAVSLSEFPGTTAKVELPTGRAIVCTVRTRTGDAISGAEVWAETLVGQERTVTHGTTDDAGRVRLAGLPAAPVSVYGKAPGHAWGRALVDDTAVTASLALDAGQPLRMLVSNANGRPLPGVSVDIEAESPDAASVVLPPAPGALILTRGAALPRADAPNASGGTTGLHGELAIPDLPPGLYTLRLHLDGHHPEIIRSVAPGPRTWFLTLVPKAK